MFTNWKAVGVVTALGLLALGGMTATAASAQIIRPIEEARGITSSSHAIYETLRADGRRARSDARQADRAWFDANKLPEEARDLLRDCVASGLGRVSTDLTHSAVYGGSFSFRSELKRG